jgi:hypothetical protein
LNGYIAMESSNANDRGEPKREDKRFSRGSMKATLESDDDEEGDVLGMGFLDSDRELSVDEPKTLTSPSSIPQAAPLQNVESVATVRSGNTQKMRNNRNDSLSDLFDAPPTPPQNEPSRVLPPLKPNGNADSKITLPNGQPPPSHNLPRPKPVQDRTVSWDQSVLDSPLPSIGRNAYPKNTLLQPSLDNSSKDTISYSPPRTTIDWGDFREMSPPRERTMTAESSRRKVGLEQLMKEASPLETEAEAHILQELEQRTPTRSRANTGTSTLFSNVPDENVHNFAMSKQGSAMNITSANFSEGAILNAPVASVDINRSSHSSNTSGGQPLVRLPSTRPPLRGGGAKLQPALLKRNRTIEETLFGLEVTMRAIHDVENQDVANPEEQLIPSTIGGRPRLFSKDAKQPIPLTSADTLAQNANAIFARAAPKRTPSERPGNVNTASNAVDDSNASVESNVKKGGSRWNLFADPSSHSKSSADRKKKLDDVEIDEEFAVPPPQASIQEVSTGDNRNPQDSTSNGKKKNDTKTKPSEVMEKEDYEFLHDFLRPRKASIIFYCKTALFYLMMPATVVAAILFYWADNPPTGKAGRDGERSGDQNTASVSWWILFVCVRQVITFSLARATEALLIDFLSLRTRWTLRIFGPVLTLFIVQSKGWPFTIFTWALFDFALLQGPHSYASHWLYWQSHIDLFNVRNPAGEVVRSVWNKRSLAVAVSVGVIVAVKRLMLGLYLGRQTFGELQSVVNYNSIQPKI